MTRQIKDRISVYGKVKRALAAFAAALLAFALCVPSGAELRGVTRVKPQTVYAVPKTPETGAAAMALIEASTGRLLARQNSGERLPMASTTKIMTALIVIESCSLDEIVTVDVSAEGVEGSSMYLAAGERITVEDLLYGLMLASGNDAAVALACHVSGSAEAFAERMNSRAERLGLTDTHFVTPNGLHAEGHYTTAYELCLTAREAMRSEIFRRIVSAQYHTTTSGDHPRTFKNKNSLLWDYQGALGVKTGYTMAAGRCLVFAAERDGMTVIGALLNCRPMFERAADLLDFAFENFRLCTVLEAGTALLTANVKNGSRNVLAVETKNSIITVVSREDGAFSEDLIAECRLYDIEAPVYKGDIVGEATVFCGGEPIGSCALVAGETVPARSFLYWFTALAGAFS